MKCSLRPLRYLVLCLGFTSILVCASAFAQGERVLTPPQRQKPINLDEELDGPVTPDRAASYYHFSLAKFYEGNGDFSKALSEMQAALKYNPSSPAVHLEMAALLDRPEIGNISEAVENAQEAVRLDPQDPDPHWVLVNIYFGGQRGAAASDGVQKGVQELEKLKQLTPTDERVYYALGRAYFTLDNPEKAIEAYEKFQSLSSGRDDGYREIAQYYDRKGDEEKAVEYLNKALKIQPDSPDSLALLASIYTKTSKNKEAADVYRKLREVTGNNVNVSLSLAASLLEANEFGEALKVLDDIAKNPQDKNPQVESAVQTYRGRAQLGLRKYVEAIQTLQSVLETDPNALDASFYLGRAYEESGKYAESTKIFSGLLEKSLEKPTDNSEEAKSNRFVFQLHLAADYMEMKDYGRAIAIYQEMAKSDPKRGNPQLLNAYRISRQFDKAIPLGKQLYEKDSSDIDVGVTYARTLADAGRPKEGAEILFKMLQSNPDNIEIYVNLSQVYLQDKRYSDAEKILHRAEGKSSDSENTERLKIQQATVYDKQKDFDRAESVLKEILKMNPQNAVALNYIGYMLADRGVRLDEALQYVKEALAIDPQNGAYLDSLGWAYFKMNDLSNAKQYLLEADKLINDDPTIDEHLGDLYFKTGDLEKAEEFWKKSVSLGTEQDDIQKVRRKLDALQQTIRKQKPAKQ